MAQNVQSGDRGCEKDSLVVWMGRDQKYGPWFLDWLLYAPPRRHQEEQEAVRYQREGCQAQHDQKDGPCGQCFAFAFAYGMLNFHSSIRVRVDEPYTLDADHFNDELIWEVRETRLVPIQVALSCDALVHDQRVLKSIASRCTGDKVIGRGCL
jgi:hypothetical protein